VSHTFKASLISDAESREEFARLQRNLNDPQPEFTLQVRHSAPPKTWAGMLILADGVDYDPGSGEGLYRRDKTNASWVFIG
jgi:hypothetical protein